MSAHPIAAATPMKEPDERMLYAQIRHLGRTLDDIENLRIRHINRREAFQREHQTILPPDSVLDTLAVAERGAELELKRLARRLDLIEWQRSKVGVGEKQFARLIAEIGIPHLKADGTPRTVSQLSAYCGFDPNRKRRKGMSQEEALACGNPHAKARAHLIAAKCIMFVGKTDKLGRQTARSPYRDVYEARRAHTAVSHPDWPDGHRHNDALRIVAKTVLRHLWIASRQHSPDTHPRGAGGAS